MSTSTGCCSTACSGALIFRGIFIAAGSVLIASFAWILYLFGAFLVLTGIKMARTRDEHVDPEKSLVLRLFRRFVPMTDEYDGQRFLVRRAGRLLATPLLAVLVLVEVTDIVFAVDSIPAIFAVTQEPFLVFTSNAFAILGLRAMYFLLADLIHRFVYLKLGLAIVLVWVGVKMLLLEVYKIPTTVSLAVVVGIITVSVVASLRATRSIRAGDADEADEADDADDADPALPVGFDDRADHGRPGAASAVHARGEPGAVPRLRRRRRRSAGRGARRHRREEPAMTATPARRRPARTRPSTEEVPVPRSTARVAVPRGPMLTEEGRARLAERARLLRERTLPELRPLLVEWDRDERHVAEFERVQAELDRLERLLAEADTVHVDVATAPAAVPLGARVLIEMPDGGRETVRVVHPDEAWLDDERISTTSPLARVLLGAPVGSTVWVSAPAGAWPCRVVDVLPEGSTGAVDHPGAGVDLVSGAA